MPLPTPLASRPLTSLLRLPPVLVLSQLGDHMSAMRVLTLTLHDVAAAEAYARTHLAPGDYRALLHLVLEPGQGLDPRWEDACYLIAALGTLWSSVTLPCTTGAAGEEVLQARPPSIPLFRSPAALHCSCVCSPSSSTLPQATTSTLRRSSKLCRPPCR